MPGERLNAGERVAAMSGPSLQVRRKNLIQQRRFRCERRETCSSEKSLIKKRSNEVAEDVEVIKLDDLEAEATLTKKSAKINEENTSNMDKKIENKTTELRASDMKTMKNTLEKLASTCEVLELTVFQKP